MGIESVGSTVVDFEIDVFDPARGDFARVSLADLKSQKKWTILFFYPGDYTFVCPTELADFAALQDQFAEQGAQLISVSTDTKYVHFAWQREERLLAGVRYLMGADPNGKLSKQFGVYDDASGMALRGTFIISPEGKLAASEINFFNVGRSAEETLRKVKANVYVTAHPEEACPAKWNPGEQTLKPGAGLIGRVGDSFEKQGV